MGEARRRLLAGNYPERAKHMEQFKPGQPQQQRPKLIIEVLEDGRVNVNGPINDKVLCYGLLEVARDAIYEYGLRASANKSGTEQQASPRSVLKPYVLPGGLTP